MRKIAKRLLPVRLRLRIRAERLKRGIRQDFRKDRARYTAAAALSESSTSDLTPVHVEAQLTRDYHRVEKGLALSDPKRPFGSEVAARLDALLPAATVAAPDAAYVVAAASARDALEAWNDEGIVHDGVAPRPPAPTHVLPDPASFFGSRHSVRHFGPAPVDPFLVEEAVRLALHSPSVCNRQPWRVRLYEGAEVPRLLRHQNGNRGFTHSVPVLALISVELGYFAGSGERNQPWIEGGIFATTLMWALHAVGMDCCMLNLSVTSSRADALREESGMPVSEVPIMMMAIGHGATDRRVARSPRRSLSDVLVTARR